MCNRVEHKNLITTADLEASLPRWQRLWERDPHATPFQSPAWLMPWWHQFGQPELRAVTIERDGEWIGFLPLYIYRDPRSGERQLLPLGIGTSDYLDGVFAPECSPEEVLAALETVWGAEAIGGSAPGDWDTMVLSQLRPLSKLYRALDGAADLPLVRFEAEICSGMPALRVGDLPQKIRRNVMYYRNRARRLGRLELTVADQSSGEEAFAALQRLHRTRWQKQGQPGVLEDPRVLAWHREARPLLIQLGILRLCSLALNGQIIAVLYAFVDPPGRAERTQYFYLMAYSTEHAELRPGTLLLAYAIEQAAEEGVATIDNLRGNEAYQEIWHMQRSANYGFSMSRSQYRQRQARVAA
jgi:CelD/BcsL family acetyltransferase involved in cellulose biosynthesis